ncbi:neural-cadherin-like [Mya arenaria]|uniref:neural-cadherin-like n=1 Tax=Mya arenaria TaxID=6604 RepID=UPI0022E54141|nr:neural-cadherin-like [Mya arenaria]
MAAFSGRKRHKNVVFRALLLCYVLQTVPYCCGSNIPFEDLKLSVSEDAEIGTIVIRDDIIVKECIQILHIQRSRQAPSHPFSLQPDGSLVTNSSLKYFVGDLFVVKHQSSESCSVSSPNLTPIHIEVIPSRDVLRFQRNGYRGLIPARPVYGTLVEGISDLYAVSDAGHENNVEYKIVGSDNFFLQTFSKEGHIQLAVYVKRPLSQTKQSEKFMIIAMNANGQEGYTHIEVKTIASIDHYAVAKIDDSNLYFKPTYNEHKSRHRRQTAVDVILPDKTVQETATGTLFSVQNATQDNDNYRYTLKSSTYQNAFAVDSVSGGVSVVAGFKLDYETFVPLNNGSARIELTITVTDSSKAENSSEYVVKTLLQPVILSDVNDESPVFTNEFFPYYAVVSLNAAANSLVYSITASDPDRDAQLSLSHEFDGNAGDFFDVTFNNAVADIKRKGQQPFTQDQVLRITIKATDTAGASSQVTSAVVEVKVGTRRPQFSKENGYKFQFQEDNAVNQKITTPQNRIKVKSFQPNSISLAVLDEFSQVSQMFEARVSDSSVGGVYNADLHVKQVVDYETNPQIYSLTIRATEGSTGLTSTTTLEIDVTDKNEFDPAFTISTYKKENVREDIATGSVLLTVTARDSDLNTKMSFSVNNDHFRVVPLNPENTTSPYTANIVVNKILDYDRLPVKLYGFDIYATDDGDIPRSGSATVQIFMTNVNDESPEFPADMQSGLRYDAAVGSDVYLAKATDADGDRITYSFLETYQKFRLDTSTGSVTLRETIASTQSSITQFEYQLKVIAVDDGSCCGSITTRSSTGTLTVNILTDNENRPRFPDCQSLTPHIEEEQADAFIVKVTALDSDFGRNGDVTYSLREGTASQFRINSTTGDLYTRIAIDRETLGSTKIAVNIIGTDGGGLNGTCPLLIQVDDINDNPPTFTESEFVFPVLKTALPGTVAGLVEAKDIDIGVNGQIVYSFTDNPGGYFRFDDSGQYIGSFKVNQSLPLETPRLVLKVMGRDQGDPALSSSATVVINLITDADAQPPKWLGADSSFQVSVPENHIKANALINFAANSSSAMPTLSFGVTDSFDKLFYTFAQTSNGRIQAGSLRHLYDFDYEKVTQYIVRLRATDVENQQAIKISTVTITDVNDNQPRFLGINPDNSFLELRIQEGDYTNAPQDGELVDTINAVDDDGTAPNNQIQEYRITSDDSGFFQIDATSGRLTTRANIDREQNEVYTIQVEAVDAAPSSFLPNGQHNTGQVTVKVIIGDENDNAPYFDKSVYTFDANEDMQIGTVVARVSAKDLDSDSVMTYRILDPNSGKPLPFSVIPQTGDITVAGDLDYDEGERRYVFAIEVFDLKFTGRTNVTINIMDVNDNPPVVQSYTFDNITENDLSVVGQTLVKVHATDKDNNGVNSFFFDLKFTDDIGPQYFEIGQDTGDLKIKKALDRDYPNGLAEFKFTVEVSDAPANQRPLIGYGDVTVKPIDVNDNAPVFLDQYMQLSVQEEQDPVVQVGKVTVLDYDDPNLDNSKFDLSLLGQTPDSTNPHFELRIQDVSAISRLDRETQDKYYLSLQAVDKGNPSMTGTGTLTITVTDINDNAPFFNQSYKFVFSENQRDEFGRIQAYDADIGVNAELTYSLDEDSFKYFKMMQDREENQGVLTIFQAVDYDDLTNLQRNFNLTAYVVDSNPAHRAQTYIEIEVTDYNDEVPKFVEPQKSVTLREDVEVGKSIAHFNATDRDVNPDFSHFEYYIAQASDRSNRFRINQDGEVFIRNPLDFETHQVHIVHILAIDNINAYPQNTGTATLTVSVLDVNDNYPDFAQTYTPSLMENKEYNANQLLVFSAIDADGPGNGSPFSFELECSAVGASPQCDCSRQGANCRDNEKENRFTLSMTAISATITVTGTFDRENEKVVRLPVKMCDVAGMNRQDQQCGIRFLDVDITDENDNINHDGNQFITVYNYKGLFGNIVIGTVDDFDLDDNDNDKVFSLQNEAVSGKFVMIDPTTGDITLKPKVPEMSFSIKVSVQDQTTRPATTTNVRITVVYVTEDAVFNSGSIRINGVSPSDFLHQPFLPGSTTNYRDSMYIKFRKLLAVKLYGSSSGTDVEKVQIVSVMGNSSHTDVRFSAHGSPWYQSSRMDGIVTANKQEFQDTLTNEDLTNTGEIDMVPIDMCRFETCEGGCFNKLVVNDNPVLVKSGGMSYVGVDTDVQGRCGCRSKDFSGGVECTLGYCYHGGTCLKDSWGKVGCTCPEGFEGPRCQKLRQSFNGTGYALYRQLEQCEESRTSIQILTSKATQLILYNGPIADLEPIDPTDFILLELVDGFPKLRINHGTGEVALNLTGSSKKRLNDNTWHTIDIHRNKKYVRMVVDHCVDSTMVNGVEDRSGCEASGYTRGENIYVNVVQVLQLGGRMTQPSYPANVITEKFNGCMRNLIHNAEIYDLSTGGQFIGSQDGCPREDEACGTAGCGEGQCQVTGVVGGQLKGTCICNQGWRKSTSDLCDTMVSECSLMTESFMDWKLKNTFKAALNSKEMTISFHIRTRDTDGLVYSVSDETTSSKFIKFMVVGGRLQVVYNLGDGEVTLRLSEVEVNNGQYHLVKLERYGKEFMLRLDGGERQFYTETIGPTNGMKEFRTRQDQIYAGATVSYTSGSPVFTSDDFSSSCMKDIRYDNGWFPVTNEEEGLSPAAEIVSIVNTEANCSRNDCPVGKCTPPLICVPLWEDFACSCPEHYIKSGANCEEIDYCADNPCFGGTCTNNVPPGLNEEPYMCTCTGEWYGSLCQCHPSLESGGVQCNKETEEKAVVGMAGGIIAAIILGILFAIVAVILIIYLLTCRKKGEEKGEPFEDDFDDDIRENIMYYDEEGAGEEDQTRYDLSRLRKPDTGDHPAIWPDVRKDSVKPLGNADRPDIGDFIGDRLNNADDDPSSPPYDVPHNFDYEGGNSDAGSLSSLNTSSSGSQDYDYLNEWGPKFARLADMYNNYDDAE